MECPKCHTENSPDAGFCEDCGMVLEPRCPHCQADHRQTSRFCRKCGLPLTGHSAASPAPEAECPQRAAVLYPRCGSVNVRKRALVACRCLYDATGRARKEVRTFGAKTHELLQLSDWLGAQGVTHVAVARNGGDWLRVYRVLEHAFTVLRTTEVNDAEALAERLAIGLIQDSSPSPATAGRWRQYRSGLVALAMLCGPMLIALGIWQYAIHPVPAATPTEAPLAPLPPITAVESIEVTLEETGDRPHWLQFDGSSVHINGVAPLTAGDGLYHLILRAKAGDSSNQHLHLYVTRTELAEPNLSPPSTEPEPTPTSRPVDTRYLPGHVKFGW